MSLVVAGAVRRCKMRLRVNCCCAGVLAEELPRIRRRKGTIIEIQTKPPLTEQPRRGESLQLEVIDTARFSERSSGSRTTRSVSETAFTIPETPLSKTEPTVCTTSRFSYVARTGERTDMTFEQTDIGCIRGKYQGTEFTIVSGNLQTKSGSYSPQEQDLIMRNYSQTLLALQQGLMGIECRLLDALGQQMPQMSLRQLADSALPAKSKINVNFTADNGKKFRMTFRQIKPGLFHGTCDQYKFSIANGQVLLPKGTDSGLNRELVLTSFHRALIGISQTSLGLEVGERVIESRLPGRQLNPMELLKAACPEKRLQFQTECLQVHNEFRKLHGVPPLTHSELLCDMAREWAEHLALKDTSYYRPNNEYGENLFFSHGLALNARKAVSAWYDEINFYNYSDPQLTKETGHFTQLVWRDTKEMGTGIAQLGDKVWVCCYYHPPGNIPSRLSEKNVPRPLDYR